MYVCTYACMHKCMYVCICVRTYVRTYVCMHVCMYVYMYACIYVCMHACMHACMYACICVCVCVCVSVCVCFCLFVTLFEATPHRYLTMHARACPNPTQLKKRSEIAIAQALTTTTRLVPYNPLATPLPPCPNGGTPSRLDLPMLPWFPTD